MFGFSVYLDAAMNERKREYLQAMQQSGFRAVFTSLQIPEEDAEQKLTRLTELGRECQRLKLMLTVDVSAEALSQLDLSVQHPESLKALGITGIRADDGLNNDELAELSQHIKLILNASTITEADLRAMKLSGAKFSNIQAWHNFYPRPETGISMDFLVKRHNLLSKFGVQDCAFVSGDATLRQPMFKGLPTIEVLRDMAPFSAAMLIMDTGVDNIFIGDPELSPSARQQFSNYLMHDELTLRVKDVDPTVSKWILRQHTNRLDDAEYVFRSAESRSWKLNVAPNHCESRPVGAVILANEQYGRYAGEIDIVKKLLPSDEKMNVVAQVIHADLPLVSRLGPGTIVRLIANDGA